MRMKWYAANIIMYTKFKDGIQDKYPVWENIVLIKAKSADEAWEKAEKKGKKGEGDSRGTYRYGDRPATWIFAGVRKLLEVVDSENRPVDGTEITYSEMEVYDEESLNKLVNGDPVTILYEE